MKNFLLIIVLLAIVVFGLYVAGSTVGKLLAPQTATSTAGATSSSAWQRYIGLPSGGDFGFGVASTATAPSPVSGGSAAAPAANRSRYDGMVRIVSVVPRNAAGVSEVTLQRTAGGGAVSVGGWKLRGDSGEEMIRPDQNVFANEFRVALRRSVFNAQHDRVRLADDRGVVVDEYVY